MSESQFFESSSIKAKRAAKNTVILYIRMLFTMFIGLYTSRVILDSLGVNDFGLYNVIGGIVGFLGFINGSLSVATIRYIAYEQGHHSNVDRLHSVFCTSKIIHIIIYVNTNVLTIATTVVALYQG